MLRAALALLCALVAMPSWAQSRNANGTPAVGQTRATLLEPASLVKMTDMDFGWIAARPTIGTVVLDPASNSCTTTGTIVHAGACQPAEFAGRGRRNLIARLTFPTSINLNRAGGGGTMVLDTFTFDASGDLQLQANGNGNGNGNIRYRILSNSGMFTFRMGGTLHVGANQAPGAYVGSFNVTVQYQ